MMRKYLVFVVLSLLFVSVADAFTVSPSKSIFTIDPGVEKQIKIEVKNTDNKNYEFRAKVVGVRQKNDGTAEFLSSISKAEKWVTVKNNAILIEQNKKDFFIFDIAVPKSASAGSYYLGLVIYPAAPDNSQLGVMGQIISLLNIQVGGKAQESIEITKWELDKNNLAKDELIFWLNLANNGNMDLDLHGKVTIYDERKNVVEERNINLGNLFLAGSVRFAKPEIKLQKSTVLPHIYSAKVTVKYGLLKQEVISTSSFWYFPIAAKVVGVIFISFIIVGFLYLIKRKKLRKS